MGLLDRTAMYWGLAVALGLVLVEVVMATVFGLDVTALLMGLVLQRYYLLSSLHLLHAMRCVPMNPTCCRWLRGRPRLVKCCPHGNRQEAA